jgi:hypothetical protein
MTIIEDFKSYSPETAWGNDGFSSALFKKLAELEEKSFWFRSRNNVIINLFSKYSGSESGIFLEIGCGTGYVIQGI